MTIRKAFGLTLAMGLCALTIHASGAAAGRPAEPSLPRLTAEACTRADFNPNDYDLAYEDCAADFTTPDPAPLDRDEILANRKACMAERAEGLGTCRARHRDGRALHSCNRAVNSNHRACLFQARVAQITPPGPEKFRASTCSAARNGLLEICFHYRANHGPGVMKVAAGTAPTATPVPPTPTPTPPAGPTPTATPCTETCVEDCVDQYYEDYDYNAEQLCYYDHCLC